MSLLSVGKSLLGLIGATGEMQFHLYLTDKFGATFLIAVFTFQTAVSFAEAPFQNGAISTFCRRLCGMPPETYQKP
jgi:hypothetical protein